MYEISMTQTIKERLELVKKPCPKEPKEADYREGDVEFVKNRSHNTAVRAVKEFISNMNSKTGDNQLAPYQ